MGTSFPVLTQPLISVRSPRFSIWYRMKRVLGSITFSVVARSSRPVWRFLSVTRGPNHHCFPSSSSARCLLMAASTLLEAEYSVMKPFVKTLNALFRVSFCIFVLCACHPPDRSFFSAVCVPFRFPSSTKEELLHFSLVCSTLLNGMYYGQIQGGRLHYGRTVQRQHSRGSGWHLLRVWEAMLPPAVVQCDFL